MTVVTKALGAAPGIQWQGVVDQSGGSRSGSLGVGLFLGAFGRGRLDRAFPVTADTISARLGYDPSDADYMAVQDALDSGIPQVWVRRIRAGMAETVAESGTFDNYTLPSRVVTVVAGGTVGLAGSSPKLSITFEMEDVMDDGCKLDVAFFQRAGSMTVTGLDDIIARLVWKDSVTGEELYRLSGLLQSRDGEPSLAQSAEDSELFSVFTVTASVAADAVTAILASAAYNSTGTLGRGKATLTIPAISAGATATPPTAYMNAVFDDVRQMADKPKYIGVAKTSALTTWTLAMRLMDKLNCHLVGELAGNLSIDNAVALAASLDPADHRVALFYNPHPARPRDAISVRGAKAIRPVIGVQIGYRLLRNAAIDARGIPPLNVPIAGYDFPVRFKGMTASNDVVLDEPALNRLAEAKITPVLFERYEDGGRFVFGDLLTQYGGSKTSALRLSNAAEIITFTEDVVLQIIRRHMLRGMNRFIDSADTDCRRFLDGCVTAGLLVPAEDLDGYPYVLSITPREDRPFDGVNVSLGRRPEGAVRAVYFNDTVNK